LAGLGVTGYGFGTPVMSFQLALLVTRPTLMPLVCDCNTHPDGQLNVKTPPLKELVSVALPLLGAVTCNTTLPPVVVMVPTLPLREPLSITGVALKAPVLPEAVYVAKV
jgi:hypothetical protein